MSEALWVYLSYRYECIRLLFLCTSSRRHIKKKKNNNNYNNSTKNKIKIRNRFLKKMLLIRRVITSFEKRIC